MNFNIIFGIILFFGFIIIRSKYKTN